RAFLVKLLVAPEKESPVGAVVELRNANRTAERKAPIVLAYFVAGTEIWLVGVQRLIRPVVVGAAVILIAAALGDHVYHRSTGGPILRGEVAGLNRHFLKRVDGGLRLHLGAQEAGAG